MVTATAPLDNGKSGVLAGPESSEDAIAHFWKEVCDAKRKHNIKDVLLIGLTRYKIKEDEEEQPFHCHAGDEMLLHTIATKIIDRLAKRRQARMDKLGSADVKRMRA